MRRFILGKPENENSFRRGLFCAPCLMAFSFCKGATSGSFRLCPSFIDTRLTVLSERMIDESSVFCAMATCFVMSFRLLCGLVLGECGVLRAPELRLTGAFVECLLGLACSIIFSLISRNFCSSSRMVKSVTLLCRLAGRLADWPPRVFVTFSSKVRLCSVINSHEAPRRTMLTATLKVIKLQAFCKLIQVKGDERLPLVACQYTTYQRKVKSKQRQEYWSLKVKEPKKIRIDSMAKGRGMKPIRREITSQ